MKPNYDHLVGKHIAYRDRQQKYRVNKYVKVSGNTLTARDAVKCRHRVPAKQCLG